MRNLIIEKYTTHRGLTADFIRYALEEVVRETGFVPGEEVHRRFIFDPAQTWRVRIAGTYQGHPATVRIENIEPEIDEERIRQLFRQQASGSLVRPPKTYAHSPFDERRGFGWSIEELVEGEPLFQSTDDPNEAAAHFAVFYRLLRTAVSRPFWGQGSGDAHGFCVEQFTNWAKLARELYPREGIGRHRDLLIQLSEVVRGHARGRQLHFMHPHLAPGDVRVTKDGTYVIFANHMWSWRQPGYDVAFPCWGQWLSLPTSRRTPEGVNEVTTAWDEMVKRDLSDLVDPSDFRSMLLNRLYGSLMLDVPAKQRFETPEEVKALESALVAEAERLLGA